MSNKYQKTEKMKKYEDETGKQAIWQGKVTKGFIKWKDGEKDYYFDKKRISVYISNETEKKWQDFLSKHDFSSFSKLIREAVNYYINEKSRFAYKVLTGLEIETSSSITHELKERLSTIKGFLQLIIEKYKDDLNEDIISIIENVLRESKKLEIKFITESEKREPKSPQYDVLLIEDDISTVSLLQNYFETKGYSFKGVLTGLKGIEELNLNYPKLILLDIILPDISGFEICKNIKSHERLKDIPVIYLTAVPGSKVEIRMKDTKADGYILKPFDLSDFEFLFNYLS